MIYFDAAYISKCYLNEPGSQEVIELASTSDGLCSSEYGRLEFFSVLHRHRREGALTHKQAGQILEYFSQDEDEEVWYWLPMTSALLGKICTYVHSLPRNAFIRAGDALHLGSAKERGFVEIYTSDHHMLAAARHFDLVGKNVIRGKA